MLSLETISSPMIIPKLARIGEMLNQQLDPKTRTTSRLLDRLSPRQGGYHLVVGSLIDRGLFCL